MGRPQHNPLEVVITVGSNDRRSWSTTLLQPFHITAVDVPKSWGVGGVSLKLSPSITDQNGTVPEQRAWPRYLFMKHTITPRSGVKQKERGNTEK